MRTIVAMAVFGAAVLVGGCSALPAAGPAASPQASSMPTAQASAIDDKGAPDTSALLPQATVAANITPDQAIAAVEKFVPDLGTAQVEGPFAAADSSYFSVSAGAAQANVDGIDGHVRTLVIFGSSPESDAVSVSATDAAASATAFLTSHQVPIAGFTIDVQLADHGETKQFDATWTQRSNGALTPDLRSVSVAPDTGKVFAFVNISRPYKTPPEAVVSQQQAVADAAQAVGQSTLDVESSDLVIAFDAGGAQLLVWQIAAMDPKSSAAYLFHVDALSGKVEVVGRG